MLAYLYSYKRDRLETEKDRSLMRDAVEMGQRRERFSDYEPLKKMKVP